MNQSVLMDADIDKSAKIGDIAHNTLQDHVRPEILEFQDIAAQGRLRQVVARIAPRPGQGVEDIRESQLAQAELGSQLRHLPLRDRAFAASSGEGGSPSSRLSA